MPLLSIIITVYNLENYIEECLHSVLDQDFEDYEIVLVDNVSTDRSGEICAAYAEKYKQINYIRLEGQNIIGRAHFVGLAEAKGEYIHYIDGDDYVAEGCYAEIIGIIRERKPDVVFGSFICRPEKGAKQLKDALIHPDKINDSTYENVLRYLMALPNFHMMHWRYVAKKRIVMNPGDTRRKLYARKISLSNCNDVIMAAGILVKARSLYYYDKPFYIYRTRPAGAVTSQITVKHYQDYFLGIFRLLNLIDMLNCQGIQRMFVFSRIEALFKLFCAGCDMMDHQGISQLAETIDKNKQYLEWLKEMQDSGIEILCDFISCFGGYQGLSLYMAYEKSKVLSSLRGREKYDIYVFPTGHSGESTARILKDAGFNIRGFLDNDPAKKGWTVMDIVCSLPGDLNGLSKTKLNNVLVLISTIYSNLVPVLKQQLLDLGLSKNQIVIKE